MLHLYLLSKQPTILTRQLCDQVNSIISHLITLRTQIEAHIDFPDEDIEPQSINAFSLAITDIKTDIDKLVQSAHEGVKLNRTSHEIVLIGEPNAKSSLLNALARAPLAHRD